MNVYHEAVTFIRGRLGGAVVKRLTSVVEFRVRSFVCPNFPFLIFSSFMLHYGTNGALIFLLL